MILITTKVICEYLYMSRKVAFHQHKLSYCNCWLLDTGGTADENERILQHLAVLESHNQIGTAHFSPHFQNAHAKAWTNHFQSDSTLATRQMVRSDSLRQKIPTQYGHSRSLNTCNRLYNTHPYQQSSARIFGAIYQVMKERAW